MPIPLKKLFSVHSWSWDSIFLPEKIFLVISFSQVILSLRVVTYSSFFRRRQWHPTPVLLPGKSHGWRSLVGCSPLGRYKSDSTERRHFHTLEKEVATHSSVLALRIPGMGEPGELLPMGSHGVGHDWSDLAAAAAFFFVKVYYIYK